MPYNLNYNIILIAFLVKQFAKMKMETRNPAGRSGSNPFSCFSTFFSVPFVCYDYIRGSERMVTVDLLVPLLHKDQFRIKVHSSGWFLEVFTVVPTFFFNPDRLLLANPNYTRDTQRVASLQASCNQVTKYFKDSKTGDILCATPQRIRLPFKVKRAIAGGINQMLHLNEDERVEEENELDEQFHVVLSVELMAEEQIMNNGTGRTQVVRRRRREIRDDDAETVRGGGSGDGGFAAGVDHIYNGGDMDDI